MTSELSFDSPQNEFVDARSEQIKRILHQEKTDFTGNDRDKWKKWVPWMWLIEGVEFVLGKSDGSIGHINIALFGSSEGFLMAAVQKVALAEYQTRTSYGNDVNVLIDAVRDAWSAMIKKIPDERTPPEVN